MPNIFFTSDTFFGRNLAAVQRGFNSTEEMDDVLIDRWNAKVKPDDIVYHLGNFAWEPIASESASAHLNGKINFILGFYDSQLHQNSLIKMNQHVILPPLMVIPSINVVLSHWPLMDWPEKENGSIHIHGGKMPTTITSKEIRFNANCELWSYEPIDIDTLKDIVDTYLK